VAHVDQSRAHDKRRLLQAFGLTSSYLIVEVIGGLWTNSLALLADAGHMLTDVCGLLLALVAITLAARPATVTRTYGYYRVEILAAVANAVLLLGVSAYILYEAYERLVDPPAVTSGVMLIVAVIGLVVNLIGMRLMQEGVDRSLNVKGAYLELLSDTISSVGVIIAAIVMWTTGWYYADPLLSAGIGLFILPRTWSLLRDAIAILMEGTPPHLDLNDVRASLEALDGVLAVHDLHAWSITSGVPALSCHVVRKADADAADVMRRAHECVRTRYGIDHATIQVEGPDWAEAETHA